MIGVGWALLPWWLLATRAASSFAVEEAPAVIKKRSEHRGGGVAAPVVTVEGLTLHAPPTWTDTSDEREWFLRCVPRPPRPDEGEAWGGPNPTHPLRWHRLEEEPAELRGVIPVVEKLAPRVLEAYVPLGSYPLGAWPGALGAAGMNEGGDSSSRARYPALTCSLYDVDAAAAAASVSTATLRLSQFSSTTSAAVLEFARVDPRQPERGETQRWMSIALKCDACYEAAEAAEAATAGDARANVQREPTTGAADEDEVTWRRVNGGEGSNGNITTIQTAHSPGHHGDVNTEKRQPLERNASEEASAWTVPAIVSAALHDVVTRYPYGENATLLEATAVTAGELHQRFPWRTAFFIALAVSGMQCVLVGFLLLRGAVGADGQRIGVIKRKRSDFPPEWSNHDHAESGGWHQRHTTQDGALGGGSSSKISLKTMSARQSWVYAEEV